MNVHFDPREGGHLHTHFLVQETVCPSVSGPVSTKQGIDVSALGDVLDLKGQGKLEKL